MFVYLDESGNLTKTKEMFFIIATYTVNDGARISKAFRKWQKSKFPRKLRDQAEVKFNDSHLTDELRLKTIEYLTKQDIRIFYTFLNSENIPEEYRKKGIVHETGLLYTEIVAATVELYLPFTEKELMVIRDQRSLKSVPLKMFNEKLNLRLLPQLPAKINFKIQAVDSTSSVQVQVADWVCGALGRFYEGKPKGEAFYTLLKKNIIEEKELFLNYWTKKWEK